MKRLGQKEKLNEVVACMAGGSTVSSSGVNVLPLHYSTTGHKTTNMSLLK